MNTSWQRNTSLLLLELTLAHMLDSDPEELRRAAHQERHVHHVDSGDNKSSVRKAEKYRPRRTQRLAIA